MSQTASELLNGDQPGNRKRLGAKHVSCTTAPLAGERSQEQGEGALRMRKVTSNALLHQHCILPKENSMEFAGDL